MMYKAKMLLCHEGINVAAGSETNIKAAEKKTIVF